MIDGLDAFCIVSTFGMLIIHVIAYWPMRE
jgi:hypothetical protein